MFVYIQSEHHTFGGLWTVGFFKPSGEWISVSDHDVEQQAADRAHYLNGGNDAKDIAQLKQRVEKLEAENTERGWSDADIAALMGKKP